MKNLILYLIAVDTQVRNDERQGRRSKFRPLVQSQFECVHGRGADAQRGSYPLLKLEELMNADIKLYVECLVHKFKELQENSFAYPPLPPSVVASSR